MSSRPSSLYRAEFWRLGHLVARRLPNRACNWLCPGLAAAYRLSNPARRRTVVQNLLPPLDNDRLQAEAVARQLFRQFARKLADLWRYESGLPIEHLVSDWHGWEHLSAAQGRGRGILLLTPHLGNWELGAPLLARRGVKLVVITLNEPHARLTELRQASRARWGIETVVIGSDPFAFVDVIRRLDSGATVALLIDRPPVSSAAVVQLFGRPFLASIAAAELARATGCVLLPTYIPRTSTGYRAEVLPEISYARTDLAKRAGRERLTQEIVDAFAPVIRQHLAQWYHFVPIWPDNSQPPNAPNTAA